MLLAAMLLLAILLPRLADRRWASQCCTAGASITDARTWTQMRAMLSSASKPGGGMPSRCMLANMN